MNPKQQYWVVASECWQRRGDSLIHDVAFFPAAFARPLKTPRRSGQLGLAPGVAPPALSTGKKTLARCIFSDRNFLEAFTASVQSVCLYSCRS